MIINTTVKEIDGLWRQVKMTSEMLGQMAEMLTTEGAVRLDLASGASVAINRIMILPKGKKSIMIMDIDEDEVERGE